MKSPLSIFRSALFLTTLMLPNARAEEVPQTAQELSSRLSAVVQDGSTAVRLKLEMKPSASGTKTVLQLQIKSRRTKTSTDILYQVLWPKERKGEAFLLHKTDGQAFSGATFVPSNTLRPLSAASLQEGIFGSDLAYADLVENFYAWGNQTITGTETIDRTPCQILESKPGKGDSSSYGWVRSWIDAKKLVPLRIEKYLPSGQLARRIDTTRVAKNDADRPVPATFIVQRAGQESVTELEGSNSKHGVTYTDADFTPEALSTITSPK